MSVEMILTLLGGLGLFLYGMQMMSNNLEAVAGSKMKGILERLTSNRFLGVLVGAVITAVIQSSSATTVMVVGFVNTGLMNLQQAVWIIMGANIGTTITGQLIALDIGVLAPLIAFSGVMLLIFSKNKKAQYIGGIIAGLGVLFIGMGMMSSAMSPLRDSEAFVNLMTKFSNPLLGILVGAVFTAVIQSSSASVGILQALAVSGLIGIDGAVYVLFGQNIGTCITAVLASIGTGRNAKRTTIIHLMFNVMGTVIFVIICMITPFTDWLAHFTPNNPAAQIANVHTVFNITTTLLLLPFGKTLATVATKILPDKKEEIKDENKWLDEIMAVQHPLGASNIAISSLKEGMKEMLQLAYKNVERSFAAFENPDSFEMEKIKEREEAIDLYNVKLSRRISKVLSIEKSLDDINSVNSIFKIIGDIERVGDHAMNLAEYAITIKDKGLHFSASALKEIAEMKRLCAQAMSEIMDADVGNSHQILKKVVGYEQQIDDTNEQYRANQIERIRKGGCDIETSVLYTEMLTDYERIGDHILNIAQSYEKITQ